MGFGGGGGAGGGGGGGGGAGFSLGNIMKMFGGGKGGGGGAASSGGGPPTSGNLFLEIFKRAAIGHKNARDASIPRARLTDSSNQMLANQQQEAQGGGADQAQLMQGFISDLLRQQGGTDPVSQGGLLGGTKIGGRTIL